MNSARGLNFAIYLETAIAEEKEETKRLSLVKKRQLIPFYWSW